MRIAKQRAAHGGALAVLAVFCMPSYAVQFEPCFLPAAGGGTMHAAECGTLEVAENPAATDGRRIGLRVVRVPARVPRDPDPLFIFAGGPGQAASEIYPQLAAALEKINRGRDIVLIDQRGTGGSNPLHCQPLEDDVARPFDPTEVRQDAARCRRELETIADLRYYTTAQAMTDYDAVREALGYEKINLWGGSYGTRAAQVYLRLYPDHVRRVVLDSVVPPRLALGTEHAPMLDHALRLILDDCAADPACAAAYPDPAGDLAAVRERWSTAPHRVEVRAPRTGARQSMRADRETLAGSIRLLAYSSVTQALLPNLLHRAAGGEDEILLAQGLLAAERLTDEIARGMEASVMCSEDFPFFPAALEQDETLTGNAQWQAIAAICAAWPAGEVAADFHEPRHSEVPVLLLAGERDPVTPPAYADETAVQFPASQVVIVPGAGHLVLTTGCVPRLVAEFITAEDAAFSNLDTTCLDQQAAEPFFTTALGPQP